MTHRPNAIVQYCSCVPKGDLKTGPLWGMILDQSAGFYLQVGEDSQTITDLIDCLPQWHYNQQKEKANTYPSPFAHRDGPTALIDDFIQAIRTGTPPRCTTEDGVAIARVLDAVYRSLESGSLERI